MAERASRLPAYLITSAVDDRRLSRRQGYEEAAGGWPASWFVPPLFDAVAGAAPIDMLRVKPWTKLVSSIGITHFVDGPPASAFIISRYCSDIVFSSSSRAT